METTKICTKCNVQKTLSEFYKDNRPSGSNDGYRASCKICVKRYQNENKIKIKERKHNKYQENKETIKEKAREYYYKNREIVKDRMRIYRDKNRDYIYKYNKRYREENKEEISEQHKKYYKTEKGRMVSRNADAKRRAKIKKGNVDTDKLIELKNNAKKCYWCECSLNKKDIHIDHYIPLSKGGLHDMSNLVVTCKKCNLVKYNKSPLEFARINGKLL